MSLGLTSVPNLTTTRHPPIISIHSSNHLRPSILTLKRPKHQTIHSIKFRIRAQENGNNNNGDKDKVKDGFNMKWVDLLFDPDPNNIASVALTGMLTWASVQVLWQLFIIAGAVLIAALKYTVVAVLLIFILITLL